MRAILTLVIRVLIKQRRLLIFSLIGFSFCLTLVLITSSYISQEMSCDKHLKNYNRIFRIVNKTFSTVGIQDKFYNDLIINFPPIEKVCRLFKTRSMLSTNHNVVNINNLVITDSTFFNFFDYNILSANHKNPLNGPNKIVLSQSLADKLFKGENPIGKTVKVNMLTSAFVTGVISENENKSHFTPEAIISLYTQDLPYTGGTYYNNNNTWEIKQFSFYFTLKENADTASLRTMLNNHYITPWENEKPNLIIQPLSDVYWNNNVRDYFDHANQSLIFLLVTITLVVIVIAIINYINLNISSLQLETKIVSIYKVHGAARHNLMLYYALSGLVILLASLFLATILTITIIPYFYQIFHLKLNLEILFKTQYFIPLIGIFFLIFFTIITYPVIIFSRINPTNLFRGKLTNLLSVGTFSKAILVFQFTVTIVLIISTFIIFKQLNYMKNENPGFDTSYLINQNLHYSIKSKSIIDSYCQSISSNPSILKLTGSDGVPLDINMSSGTNINGSEVSYLNIFCDTSFLDVFGLKLIEGRMLLPSDKNSCIITRKLTKDCGYKDPLDEKFDSKQIIGVLEDIHGKSMHEKMQGIMFCLLEDKPSDLTIRISANNIPKTISFLKKEWELAFPDYPFNYKFYDDIVAQQYSKEQTLANSLTVIVILTILLSILGLLGVVVNLLENRIKEIGIRKVNGARIIDIILFFNKGLFRWVAIAFLLACPIAWYAMHKWLENFAYKTALSWWIFAAAGAIALVIALVTVSWQSWRAATRNPVESLRYE